MRRIVDKSRRRTASVVLLAIIAIVIILAVVLYSYGMGILSLPWEVDDTPYGIVLADTHIGRANSENRLAQAIQRINGMNPAPQFVLVVGDLTDWGEGITGETNYKRLNAELSNLECEYYVTPGNHDYRYVHQLAPPYSLNNYEAFIGDSKDYTFDHEDFHFVCMDTGPDKWEITLSPQGTGLTNEQIAWLEHDLDMLDGVENQKDLSGKVKMIAMHHPAVDVGNYGIACIGNNRQEFVDLCLKYDVYAVLSGHTHQDANVDAGGNTYNKYSTGTQFTQTLSVVESVGYRRIPLDSSKLPHTLPRSDSFDWKEAVDNPVGDYFGDD